jgi:hypothetical protein
MLVEGQTERAIVEQVFAPTLGINGVYLYPRVVGKPGHKGGNKFVTVKRELKALIKQETNSIVTMLFDYYGLSNDWPGLAETKGKLSEEIPQIIEPAIAAEIAKELGATFNPGRFIPYIQLYEIESLLFAGPHEMALIFEQSDLEPRFTEIVKACGGCERINDDPESTPSKRITRIFPGYKKGSSVNAHAYRIALAIGLERIRRQCPHLDQWLTKIEQVASVS